MARWATSECLSLPFSCVEPLGLTQSPGNQRTGSSAFAALFKGLRQTAVPSPAPPSSTKAREHENRLPRQGAHGTVARISGRRPGKAAGEGEQSVPFHGQVLLVRCRKALERPVAASVGPALAEGGQDAGL